MKSVEFKKTTKINGKEVKIDRFEASKSCKSPIKSSYESFDNNKDNSAILFPNISKCVIDTSAGVFENYALESETGEKMLFSTNTQATENENYEKGDLLIENPNTVSLTGILIKKRGELIFQVNDEGKSQIQLLKSGKVHITNNSNNLIQLLADISDTLKDLSTKISQATANGSPLSNQADFIQLSNTFTNLGNKIKTFI